MQETDYEDEKYEITVYLGESDDGDTVHFMECTNPDEQGNMKTICDIAVPRQTAIEMAKEILRCYNSEE